LRRSRPGRQDANPGSNGSSAGPAATPKAIDVTMTDGQGQAARGIYEVAGDHFRLCIGPERPAGFRPAGPASVVELERVRAGRHDA
jgi:uncharacterized protein (TIGR03067 family)